MNILHLHRNLSRVNLKASKLLLSPQRRTFFDTLLWYSRYRGGGTRSALQPFESITDSQILAESGMHSEVVYNNDLFWMPRFYQQPFLS